jgi:hypothetical protein
MPRHPVLNAKLEGGRVYRIEQQAALLERELLTANAHLRGESDHAKAVWDLISCLRRTLNLLNDRHPEAKYVSAGALSGPGTWVVPTERDDPAKR